MKKALAVVLSVIMIITMLPAMAFAEAGTDNSTEQETGARIIYSTMMTSIGEISGVSYENDTNNGVITAQEGQITIKIKNELGIGILRAVNIYSRAASDTTDSKKFDTYEGSFEFDSSGTANVVLNIDKNREYVIDEYSFYEWTCLLYSKNITLSDITGVEYENGTKRCILAAKDAGDISFKVKSAIEGRTLKSISIKSAAVTGRFDNLEYTTDEGTFDADSEGTANVTLAMEKGKTYILAVEFEDSINSVAGTIERVNSVGGADCTATVSGDTITFSGTIDYVPKDNNPAGNRVGVRIRKPNNFTFDSDVKVTMNGIEHLWKNSRGNTFGLFPNLLYPGQSIEIKVDWTEKDTQTFTVKAADDITLVPGPVAQLEKEDGTKGEIYNSLQEAIDNAGDDDVVRIIDNQIAIDKPLIIDGKTVQLWQNHGVTIQAADNFAGDSMIVVKNMGLLEGCELHLDGNNKVKYGIQTLPGDYRCAIEIDNCSFKNFTEYGVVVDGADAILMYLGTDGSNGNGAVHLISGSNPGNVTQCVLMGCEFKETNDIVYDENFNRYKPAEDWDMIIADFKPKHTTGYNSWKKGTDGIYTETIENLLSIERLNWVGGEGCSAAVDGSTITFSGTIDYVPKDNNSAGNRVGVLIKKPSDLTFDSPAKVTMNGIEHEWIEDDGDNFGLFPTIAYPGQSIEITAEWGDGNSQTFTVKAADDITLVPGPVAQLEKADGTKGETYNSLQEAIDNAEENDTVTIITDYIILDKPLIIDGKTVKLWWGASIEASSKFTGDSMIIIKNGGALEACELYLDGNNKVKNGIVTLPGEAGNVIGLDNFFIQNFSEYGIIADGAETVLLQYVSFQNNKKGDVRLISGSNEGNATKLYLWECDSDKTSGIITDENFNRYKPADEWDMIIADVEPEHTDGYISWAKTSDGTYIEKCDEGQFKISAAKLLAQISKYRADANKYSNNSKRKTYTPEEELVISGDAGYIYYLDEHGSPQINEASKYTVSQLTGVDTDQTARQLITNMLNYQEKLVRIAMQDYAAEPIGCRIIESAEVTLNDVINGHIATTDENYQVDPIKMCCAVISASSATGIAGEEITVALNLDTNPGIASMLLEIDYDRSDLEFVSAANGAVFSDSSFMASESASDGATTLSWQNSTISENITTTGNLAVLKFKIKDNAEAGKSSIKILCDYDEKQLIDIWGENIAVDSGQATVDIKTFKYGDVNNDNSVNIADALFLRRYLAKWVGYTLAAPEAAELDDYSGITLRDLTILERHIAGWKGYETLPVKGAILPMDK